MGILKFYSRKKIVSEIKVLRDFLNIYYGCNFTISIFNNNGVTSQFNIHKLSYEQSQDDKLIIRSSQFGYDSLLVIDCSGTSKWSVIRNKNARNKFSVVYTDGSSLLFELDQLDDV